MRSIRRTRRPASAARASGLAISRDFARLMQGDLVVESTPGKGSVFTFSFEAGSPRPRVPSQGASRTPIPTRAGIGSARREGADRGRRGDQPRSARRAVVADWVSSRARRRAARTPSRSTTSGIRDLVLMDVRMPGMGGLEAIRRLRQGGSKAVIVAVTASGMADDRATRRATPARMRSSGSRTARRELLAAIGERLGVRYVYGSAVARAGGHGSGRGRRRDSTLSQRLRSLPPALIDQLREAAIRRPGPAARIARGSGCGSTREDVSAEIRALAAISSTTRSCRPWQRGRTMTVRNGTTRRWTQHRGRASVLVVDDTIDNLRLLSDLLGEHGYDVRAVTSGRQALQAAEQDPPDLILLDITMPEMDGYEVCRRLRASRALAGRAGDLPDGVDRDRRQGPGVRHGRRRLRHQAFSVRGSPGASEDARRPQAGADRSWRTAMRACARSSSCATTSCSMVVHDMRSPLQSHCCSASGC